MYIHELELQMRTKVRKWGNSLGVRIPGVLAADARIAEGAEVEIIVRNGEIVIMPLLSLSELVAAITPENLPVLADEEPRGAEVW